MGFLRSFLAQSDKPQPKFCLSVRQNPPFSHNIKERKKNTLYILCLVYLVNQSGYKIKMFLNESIKIKNYNQYQT